VLTKGLEIVITNADFSNRNILLGNNLQVTVVLDCEFAGWYPEWWEYLIAYASFQQGKDGDKYILPPHMTEISLSCPMCPAFVAARRSIDNGN
jgi:hypothetical protein